MWVVRVRPAAGDATASDPRLSMALAMRFDMLRRPPARSGQIDPLHPIQTDSLSRRWHTTGT